MGIKPKKIKAIRLSFAFLLIVLCIIMYIVLHGTKNLIIVEKINSFKEIIPIFDGCFCSNKFITSYLIDILWFNSFCIFFSVWNEDKYYILLIVLAVLLELFQQIFKVLGTFDIFDIVIYLTSASVYLLGNKCHSCKLQKAD